MRRMRRTNTSTTSVYCNIITKNNISHKILSTLVFNMTIITITITITFTSIIIKIIIIIPKALVVFWGLITSTYLENKYQNKHKNEGAELTREIYSLIYFCFDQKYSSISICLSNNKDMTNINTTTVHYSIIISSSLLLSLPTTTTTTII